MKVLFDPFGDVVNERGLKGFLSTLKLLDGPYYIGKRSVFIYGSNYPYEWREPDHVVVMGSRTTKPSPPEDLEIGLPFSGVEGMGYESVVKTVHSMAPGILDCSTELDVYSIYEKRLNSAGSLFELIKLLREYESYFSRVSDNKPINYMDGYGNLPVFDTRDAADQSVPVLSWDATHLLILRDDEPIGSPKRFAIVEG